MTDTDSTAPAQAGATEDDSDVTAALWREMVSDSAAEPDAAPETDAAEDQTEDATEDPGEDEDASAALAAEREARKKAEHEARTHKGRSAAFQAQLREKAAQLAEIEKRIASGSASAAREKMQAVAEDYPEIAAPMLEAMDEQARFRADLAEAQALRQRIAWDGNRDRLSQEVPDWQTAIAEDPKRFKAWVDDQPLALREAAYRNGVEIEDPEQAAMVMRAFRDHLDGAARGDEPEAEASNPPNADRRTRQLAAATAPRAAGRSATSSIPREGDPESLWKAMRRQGLF